MPEAESELRWHALGHEFASSANHFWGSFVKIICLGLTSPGVSKEIALNCVNRSLIDGTYLLPEGKVTPDKGEDLRDLGIQWLAS